MGKKKKKEEGKEDKKENFPFSLLISS